MKIRLGRLWLIFGPFGIMAAILEMVFYNGPKGYVLLPLIPLTYVAAVTVSGACSQFISANDPGLSIVNILYFLKSVVYTFFQTLSGKLNSSFISPASSENNLAVILNIVEIIIIYFCFWLFSKGRLGKNKFYNLTEMDVQKTSRGQNIVLGAFILLVLVLVIMSPSVLYKYNFFLVSSIDVIKENVDNSDSGSITSILVEWAKVILPAIIGMWSFRRYTETNKRRYVYYALIMLALLTTIVTGVSRTSFVVTGISSCFLLMRLFPVEKKMISRVFIAVLAIVFVAFSLLRFTNFMGAGTYGFQRVSSIASTMQVYFCGIQNMAAAIRTRSIYINEITGKTFLSDMFGNWMWIGNLFRSSTNITQYFNQTIYGRALAYDQIVPTIGQAYVQFGIFGTYIYSVIMVYLITLFDRLVRSTSRIEFTLLYLLITVKCSITLMGNLRIFMASALNTYIPLFLIFWLNKYMVTGKANVGPKYSIRN